jgi:hypothetical protein
MVRIRKRLNFNQTLERKFYNGLISPYHNFIALFKMCVCF